jgi:hypothetical protein
MTFKQVVLIAALLALSHQASSAAPDSGKQKDIQAFSSGDNKPGGTSTFVSAASIEAGTSDTKATLSLVGYAPTSLSDDYFLHYQLSGEAPLSTKGSTDAVDIGTVSGLTAGSSASADLSFMRWPHASQAATSDLTSVCEHEIPRLITGVKNGVTYDWNQVSGWSDTPAICSLEIFNPQTLQSIVDGLNARLKKCDSPPPATATPQEIEAQKMVCTRLQSGGGARLTANALDAAYLRGILAQVSRIERQATEALTILSIGPKVNRQKVSYFSKDDLNTLNKTNTTGYGAHVTLTRLQGNLLYSGGFSYEKSFKNGDSAQICAPVTGSVALKCSQGSLGAPARLFSRILFTEMRYLISPGALAVSPRLEYDFTASKFAAKLPIYFAPNKDQALTGGIALGYVTHGDGFGASVFVNKAFSFL